MRSSLLDSVIRFLVWTSVIGALAAPVVLLALFNMQALFSVPFLRGGDRFTETMRDVMIDRPSAKPGIVTARRGEQRAAQIERLKGWTAQPEMVSGAAAKVHLVAVAFDDAKPEPFAPYLTARHVVDDDGYRRLTLDMARAPKDAVVLIADQPIRWTITGTEPRSWGRVGFEGIAPFDVADGRPGLLAGFRITAFGGPQTARAADPGRPHDRRRLSDLPHEKARRTFCEAARTWTAHFGVALDQAQFTLLANPTRVGPQEYTVGSDGEFRAVLAGHDIAQLCPM